MAFDALTDDYLNSASMASCFDAAATLRNALRFEAALALAQAAAGLIPSRCATAIATCAEARDYDLDALKQATLANSNPAIAIVAELSARVAAADSDAAGYVHFGATSQDVMDSATMLSCRRALELLDSHLGQLCRMLVDLVCAHRDTLMVARTLMQHAAPTTFGYKAAGWLDGLLAVRERLRVLNARLPVQCGGAVGNRAAWSAPAASPSDLPADLLADSLTGALADRLELTAAMPWHTQRGVVRELAAGVAEGAAAAGKIATDLLFMMQSEIDELREAQTPGRGTSSALPHKHNPVAAMAVVAGARRVPAALATVFAAFDHMHERAAGAWHAEWIGLRDIFVISAATLEQLKRSLDGMVVNSERMQVNLEQSRGLIMSAAVSTALAPLIGREAAQAAVTAAAERVRAHDVRFAAALADDSVIGSVITSQALAAILDPRTALGDSAVQIEQVLRRCAALDAT